MKSMFCLVVLALATVSAYNKDGKNCNIKEALSCEPAARDECVKLVESAFDGLKIDLTTFKKGNLPKASDKWAEAYYACYMLKGGFISDTGVNDKHLKERLGEGEIYTVTSDCFKKWFAEKRIMDIGNCFLNAAITEC